MQIFHSDFLIQTLDSIFYKIQSVLNIMMTVHFLFFPFLRKAAPLSIYLLFFLSIYFHQNFQPRPLPTKRIRAQLRDCKVMTVFHWPVSSQSRLGFFLSIAVLFPVFSILTIPLDKCQTKSFEDMNILIRVFHLKKKSNYCINRPKTCHVLKPK